MVRIPRWDDPQYETGYTKARMIYAYGQQAAPEFAKIADFEEYVGAGVRFHGWIGQDNKIPRDYREKIAEKYGIPVAWLNLDSSKELKRRLKRLFDHDAVVETWESLFSGAKIKSDDALVALQRDDRPIREIVDDDRRRSIIAPVTPSPAPGMTLMPASRGGSEVRNTLDGAAVFAPSDRIRFELELSNPTRSNWSALFIHRENELLTCMNSATPDGGQIILPTLSASGVLSWPEEGDDTLDAGKPSKHEQRLYALLFAPDYSVPKPLLEEFARSPQGPIVKDILNNYRENFVEKNRGRKPQFTICYASYYVMEA